MTQDEIILQSEIERCGEARFYPTSSSMRPTINPRKDVCIIGPLPRKHLKRGTMVLYRRKDGFLTINRVVHHVRKTHSYRLCGDNRKHLERGITRSQMIGVVKAIESRKSGFRFRANGVPMCIWTSLMLIRSWFAVHWYLWIQSPVSTVCSEMSAPFRKSKSRYHHHHHHSAGNGGRRPHYKAGRDVWGDLTHFFKTALPRRKSNRTPTREEQNRVRHKRGPWWKRILGIRDKSAAHHVSRSHSEFGGHHHHHQQRHAYPMFSEDGKWLTQRNGRFFFLGFRMPWVPRFILKRYGYKSTKSVNNNFLTSLDWTIPTNEFQMPYNLPMQTLSFVVFAVLIVKMSLAVGWLVYFMLYGNENSSRIYMYNLLITATWFPVTLFFIAYYYHLNKIIYMSIQRISLFAAIVSLLRTVIFIYRVVWSFQFNLVTLFNLMEIVCWICLSGFFFIMHYKLTERKDFIPRFWLTKAQKKKRQERLEAEAHARHEKRKQEIRMEYDYEQGVHLEH